MDFFNIGSSGTHVAVVTYSTYSRLEFNLKAHYTKSAIKNAVTYIRYRGGWTYTADALDFTRRNVFSKSQVSRNNAWPIKWSLKYNDLHPRLYLDPGMIIQNIKFLSYPIYTFLRNLLGARFLGVEGRWAFIVPTDLFFFFNVFDISFATSWMLSQRLALLLKIFGGYFLGE